MENYTPKVLFYTNNTSFDSLRKLIVDSNEFEVLDEITYNINSKYDIIIFDMNEITHANCDIQKLISLGHAIKSIGSDKIICLLPDYLESKDLPINCFGNIETIFFNFERTGVDVKSWLLQLHVKFDPTKFPSSFDAIKNYNFFPAYYINADPIYRLFWKLTDIKDLINA